VDAVVLVLSTQGSVEWRSVAAQQWLTTAPPGLLEVAVSSAVPGRPWNVAAGGVEICCSWIHGAGGRRILVRLQAARPRPAAVQGLSPRQRQVAQRAANGATLQEVAAELAMGVETARSHLKEVYRRTGVENRAGLALYMLEQGD